MQRTSLCTRGAVLARDRLEVLLKLWKVEPWSKLGVLGFGGQNRIGLVHTLVPPGPAALLCISPGQYRHIVLIVANGEYRMSVVGQLSGRPRFMGLKILNAILLNLKTEIHTTKDVDGLFDVCMVLRIDTDVSDNLVARDRILTPVVQDIKLVQSAVHASGEVHVQLYDRLPRHDLLPVEQSAPGGFGVRQ